MEQLHGITPSCVRTRNWQGSSLQSLLLSLGTPQFRLAPGGCRPPGRTWYENIASVQARVWFRASVFHAETRWGRLVPTPRAGSWVTTRSSTTSSVGTAEVGVWGAAEAIEIILLPPHATSTDVLEIPQILLQKHQRIWESRALIHNTGRRLASFQSCPELGPSFALMDKQI